jgi:FixJ family two-component response regulator
MNTHYGCVNIVDDDVRIHRALRRLLESAGYEVRNFICAEDFLSAPPLDEPGCLLLDVSMPGMHGMALQQALAKSKRNYPVIFLTGTGDVHTCADAMKMGAVDFLTKPCAVVDLLDAVERAMRLDIAAQDDRASRTVIEERRATLTPREHEVLKLVVSGDMNKQIAFKLGCSEKTIKVHRARVMHKMQVRSLAELVKIAALIDFARQPSSAPKHTTTPAQPFSTRGAVPLVAATPKFRSMRLSPSVELNRHALADAAQ